MCWACGGEKKNVVVEVLRYISVCVCVCVCACVRVCVCEGGTEGDING